MVKYLYIIAAIAALLILSGTASAADIYVNATGGSDDNDGLSWEAAKATVGNATLSSASGDRIWLADGEYRGEGNRNILIDRNLTITGQSTTGTVIDCEAIGRAFNVSSGAVLVLRNLTLKNGSAPEGGVVLNHGDLQVENCLLMHSTATRGGAIYSEGTVKLIESYLLENNAEDGGAVYSGGVLEVKESTFDENEASGCGGSIYSARNSSLNIRDSSFALGHAENGGGIYTGGDTFICNSTIALNTANIHGGGLCVWAADGTEVMVTVTRSVFIYNIAGYGGGISGLRNSDDSFVNLEVSDSLFRSNSANYGAGIHAATLNTTVSGCTLEENVASEHGGGIRNNYGNLTVRNTTFTGNRAGNAGGGISNFLAALANITESTFTGNLAETWNRGSAVLSYFTLTVISFCRILDNPGADVFCEDGPGVDARFNWWGSNTPDFSELTSGDVTANPWIVLTLTANPATVMVGGTSLIRADLLHDSEGTLHATPVPYRGLVDFATTYGTISDAVMSGGFASSTLRNLNAPGVAAVSAALDNQIVNTTVTVRPAPPAEGITINQLVAAAVNVRNHYLRYRKLPSSVTIASKRYSMAQFLDLLARATIQISSGNQNPLKPRAVGYAGSTGTWRSGKLSRSAYVSVAVSIRDFINRYGRAPRYASTARGRVSFTRLVYIYSRILAFYGAKGRLPVYITI
ncbi:pseudomurein-binding repeat-containing protein [Methanothermobacter sp.]|uniref:pseudomurein-binding repeat-containing protein n=1 Tax=Methanothermobacter sp. TaxID=1884223 RepID=UPI003C75AB98